MVVRRKANAISRANHGKGRRAQATLTELAARNQELAALYENAPGILFYVSVEPDGEFRFRSMNREGLVAMGLTREQVVGSLVREVIPPPSRDLVLNHYREAIRTGQTVRWKEVSVYPAGRKVGEVAVTPLYNVGGNATHLIGIVYDITERERLEEALRALCDEAHNRELSLLLETATQGIVSVDKNGNVLTANRALESMFGWPPGQLIGEAIEKLIPSALRSRHQQHRKGYFVAPHARLMRGLNLVGERKDGSTFPIEVSLNHVITPDGARAFAFVTDITERQERTSELEQRTAQLSRLASDLTLAEQHAREQLAKTLHDGLQQLLLIAALSLDQYMKRELTGTASQAELIEQARHHLEEAITAARTLSVELSPPVRQQTELSSALIWLANWTKQKYGLEVAVNVDPLANSARKDVRTLLFESVRELLLNAVKHAHVDRVTVDLELDGDDMLRISVADQGIGFDPVAVDRVKANHAGWGLFSIRERLTLLGGRFEIESVPGHGARFRLIAPKTECAHPTSTRRPSNQVRVAALNPRSASPSAAERALRIVIADDHAAMRKVFHKLLNAQLQLQVVGEAADGIEAVALAHALQPDVILMDVSMPGMDGVEATRRIRAELPSIQILGLSAHLRTEGRPGD